MIANTKDQMDKMFFTAIYADRNNIPDDVKSKLMLTTMMPTQGISSILSTVVSIDQYKEVLDQKKSLEEQLQARSNEANKLGRADKFLVTWALALYESDTENKEEVIRNLTLFLAKYILEAHQAKSLPATFSDLPEVIKEGIKNNLLLIK